MKTTTKLSEMQRHRALVAGERLGEALLVLSRWLSRAMQALRAPVRASGQ
ncbi:MAG: hypothetical protein KIT60_26305 [Burkholderiaceae bacterium]|nr:hypothetical protein [Burkholderiaceae bacterium]